MIVRRIAALLACHNRRETTLAALEQLAAQHLPPGIQIETILVDDGSTDGTGEAVRLRFPSARILNGDGGLYWNGAMTLAQNAALTEPYDFHLWLNDDVILRPEAIIKLLAVHDQEITARRTGPIIVGSTRAPDTGHPTYGGHVHRGGIHPFRFDRVFASGGPPQRCDTFNGNCVLIPASAFAVLGTNDAAFAGGQPLGDTDYGLRAAKAGIPMLIAPDSVGTCRGNDRTSPWRDATLSLAHRLKSLRGPLGPIRRQTLVFYRRHGGPGWAVWLGIHIVKTLGTAFRPIRPATGRVHFAMIEPVLTWYRRPLLSRLGRRSDMDVTLYHGTAHPAGAPSVPPPVEISHHKGCTIYWPFGGDRILWCGHVWRILSGRYDVVLMAEHVYTLSNWVIWLWRRLAGYPRIILTGQFQLDRKHPGWLSRLRRIWISGADVVAPYTDSGAHHCRTMGLRPEQVVVLRNTLDVEDIRQQAAIPADTIEAERIRLGLEHRAVFISIGRLYPGKQSPMAAQAVWNLNQAGIPAALLVIGDGEDRLALQAMVDKGAPLHLLGTETDPKRLACWFAMALATIMPDAAGLSIVHSLAHGTPVITGPGSHHGVESEYLRNGENGLMTDLLSAEALAFQLHRLIQDPELADSLRQGASKTADGLTMEAYAEHVATAVRQAAVAS